MAKKPLAGSLGHTSNGTDHLVFVPGVPEAIEDPHVRNALLLAEWENCDSAGIGPRCRVRNIGRPSTEFERAFITAMVKAAELSVAETLRTVA